MAVKTGKEMASVKRDLPDVDIDFKSREDAIEVLGGIPASIIADTAKKHNTGMYYTDIPVDPLTGFAALDYKAAEDRGYFKLDFLNLGVYEDIRDEAHLNELIAKEPNWKRLHTDKRFVNKIIHISNYYDLLVARQPSSIKEMAMLLAIIRPGKKHLQHLDWNEIEKTVWDKDPEGGYTFKKSHAISYSMVVQVHMNLIEEQEGEV